MREILSNGASLRFGGKAETGQAWDTSEVMDDITAAGLDVDQGMVLKVGERLYYGSDAIHVLALLSSRSGLFNRITVFYGCFYARIFLTGLFAESEMAD